MYCQFMQKQFCGTTKASAVARAPGFDKAHALTKCNGKYTEDGKQKTETRTAVVAERLVALLACNRPF